MTTGISVESLEELYSFLTNDEGFDILKQVLKEWEYDFDLLKDAINEEERDLQNIIPESLYTKIKTIINGEYVEPLVPQIKDDPQEQKVLHKSFINDIYNINNQSKQKSIPKNTTYDSQLIKVKSLVSGMNDGDAAQLIIEKINENEFGYDDIKDDIDDRDNSEIYDHLEENNIENVDTVFNTFSDMVINLNNYDIPDAINITVGPDLNMMIPYQNAEPVYNDSEEDEHDEMVYKEVIPHGPIHVIQHIQFKSGIVEEKEQELNDTNIDDEWNLVLKEIEHHSKLMRNTYEQGINYYRNEKYSLQDYIDTEATSYGGSVIETVPAFRHLSNEIKKELWKDLTNCVHSAVRLSRLRKQPVQMPYIPPKPKPKQNVITYSKVKQPTDERAESILISPSTQFVDDEKSEEYCRVDDILTNIEKMHVSTEMELKPHDLKERSIAFRQLAAIFGINETLLMVDLKIALKTSAFEHKTYELMVEHLNEVEKNQKVKSEYYKFIRQRFRANKYNLKQYNIYMQGLNVSQATRLLGYGRLSQIIVGIRNPENINLCNDNELDDEDSDGYMEEIKFNRSDEERLNWYSVEAQQYIYAFIVAMTKHLLKDYYHLNCGVVLDLKIPSFQQSKPATNQVNKMTEQVFRNRMDSLVGRFTPVFEHKLLRPDFKKKIEEQFKIPIWCIDVNKTENERFDEKQQPKYIGMSKKDIDVVITEKDYMKEYRKNHWFHVMRVKRYFSQKAISDKNGGGHKRIGIAVHKFQQIIKLYLHFAGGVIRIIPQDIVKWIPYLFMYRDNELDWNDINPYLQSVLKDNQNLSQMQWGMQDDGINIWTQIKSWDELDSPYMEKRNKLFQIVKKNPHMRQFAGVFK